ncbi:hypothetical protein NKH77_53975 [Streptomyces sp. M19]
MTTDTTDTTGAAGTGLLPPGVRLGFERTVPRDIAHRRQIGEVFVADSARTGEDECCLSFQIPRAHSLWSDQWDPTTTRSPPPRPPGSRSS